MHLTLHHPAQACRPGTPFPAAAPPAPLASASPRPARSPRPRATSGPRRRRTTAPRGRRPSRRWWRSRRRPGRESNRPRVRGASRATPTTPPAQAALDERWIAAPTFLDEAFPEGSADGAKLAGAVAELRLDLGPAHVAALAAAGLGDRAAFAAALWAAAAAHDAARADELKAAATTAISAATTQFSVATSAAADDGEATVHPHAYNGYLAVVAHNHTKPAMKKFVEENVDVVSLFPIVTTRSTGAVLENAFGLAVQHKTCSGPLGGDQEIGGMISLGQVDGVLFFRDPLSAHPHDDDIKALMRVCDVHCIPTANNPASGRAVVDYLAGVAARRADDIASGAATAASLIARRAAAPDSDVVARYKANQQKVIAAASA